MSTRCQPFFRGVISALHCSHCTPCTRTPLSLPLTSTSSALPISSRRRRLASCSISPNVASGCSSYHVSSPSNASLAAIKNASFRRFLDILRAIPIPFFHSSSTPTSSILASPAPASCPIPKLLSYTPNALTVDPSSLSERESGSPLH